MSAVLEAHNLSKVYTTAGGSVWAVREVTFALNQGDFAAVTGPSGCGKTTLLSLLGGLERPTSGEVRIDGRDMAAMREAELVDLRRHRLGFVFQGFYLLEYLTALENVALPGRFLGISSREQKEKAQHLLEVVGLADRMDHFPRQLSGGQQQRVAIARALMNDPLVVLADEPTGNLDDRSKHAVLELFDKLNRQGHTFIIVTHDPAVAEYAKVQIRMESGMIIETKRVSAV